MPNDISVKWVIYYRRSLKWGISEEENIFSPDFEINKETHFRSNTEESIGRCSFA